MMPVPIGRTIPLETIKTWRPQHRKYPWHEEIVKVTLRNRTTVIADRIKGSNQLLMRLTKKE